ncbi:MAG TPA: hypothetical protein VHG08_07180 [Longimicrobium sp.]|nr:hypothetical protein [Longimicrobium sp.]
MGWNVSGRRRLAFGAAAMLLGAGELRAQCERTFVANVVAIEQFVWYNRLGAHEPNQLMYVLEQDLVKDSTGAPPTWSTHQLRKGKRPRPLVLRVTAGSCLKINFRNWLSATGGELGTRAASVHVTGMQLVTAGSDGSNVGLNATSLVEPGQSRSYTLFAEREGTFLMYSTAQTTGGQGNGGQIAQGLFGAVNVEPAGAEFYRSQVTREDLDLATRGLTASNHPIINYDTLYPTWHALAGRPILRMTRGDTIVHGDLNAIITGPDRGNFAATAYPNPNVQVYNHITADSRLKPFREFTVIFHDEAGLVQAFDSIFDSDRFEYTLHGGRDAFAVNYGTGGIGAEILANRFRLGPMANCNECKFEEFFLSSWVVGDPAMVVDTPAAANFSPGNPPPPGPRATLVRYPDDPSNVFHSYLNDHVKIRNLHAGPKEHHVFHLHAHQWLHTPNSDGSNYNDSQAIGPGAGYTYEITYGGGGNRNDTPGDAILHCHFYPHFAQGMWGLWRVHDVFERGTVLDANGRPAAGSRALPDGEIATGTPIPAVVPLPTYALAPRPNANRPGYPFYIPGVAGHRPPKPPLDTRFDGGLPRHVVTGGAASFPALNTLDFSKHDDSLQVVWLPETGTADELNAMAYHENDGFNTPVADVWTSNARFHLNGLPRQPGAPFADPCGVRGEPMGVADSVKAAAFQLDTIWFNKARWFFTQHRMFGLWSDVASFRNGTRAPEPLFFRVRDNTCLTYHLVNLIPEEYEQDDFQVHTPTDVVGQHIHLVKFDVTSSDGAANGFNYEDGSLSPGDVRNRIVAIRRANGCASGYYQMPDCPGPAQAHPAFGNGPEGAWKGAQETLQRWWVDPVLRGGGRTSPLGAVFTHDHFGPSTHQQAGLYAALIPEDTGTTWRDPETGTVFGTRPDGGPTSWRADILYADTSKSFREFNLQVADFALAYGAEGFRGSIGRIPPINPPGKDEVGLPHLLRPPFARNGGPPGACPNDSLPACPELISADDPGTMLVNYRNEPLAMRIRDPADNKHANGLAGDLSFAFSSKRDRADARFHQMGPYAAPPGVLARDPFTPLLRVYEDDRVRVNVLVGAHEEGHNFGIRGTRWLFEPLDPSSGWRGSQMAAISEYFGFRLTPMLGDTLEKRSDFVYESAATDDRWNGAWGLVRVYRTRQRTLCVLNVGPCPRLEAASSSAALSARVAQEVAKEVPQDDAERIAADDTDAAEALSLTAARAEAARPDSVRAALDGAPASPDPEDDSAWRGSLATLESQEALDPRFAVSTAVAASPSTTAWSAADSVDGGYGNQPRGGFDYDQFEYTFADSTERVTTSVTPPARFGLASAGVLSYAQEPEGVPGEYEMAGPKWTGTGRGRGFDGVCPRVAPVRFYDVTAIQASRLPGGRLVYNSRTANGGPLVDSAAILYVLTSDLRRGLLTSQPDPLVLRASAGECVLVRLRNRLNNPLPDPRGWNTLPPIVDQFNANQVRPSWRVGLHPQLLAYHVHRSGGSAVGLNHHTTVPPDEWRWYVWYAGDLRTVDGGFRATPVEFGAVNLLSSDPIEHASKGAIGALVVEPRRSTWQLDPGSRVRATISTPDSTFRELVALWQDDLNLQFGSSVTLRRYDCDPDERMTEDETSVCQATNGAGTVSFAAGDPVPNLAEAEDPEDSGQKALDYRTEPMWLRMGFAPNAELGLTRRFDFRASLTDALVGGRPQTPVLEAWKGEAVRFRILQSGGHARNHVFNLHGHVWEEEPYEGRSLRLGSNPFTEWKGARDGHGPGNHHDILLRNGAGGRYTRAIEYLFRDQASFLFDGGIWGILSVKNPNTVQQQSAPACTVNATTGETTCTSN